MAVERGNTELQAILQEVREGRVGLRERGIPFAEGPQAAREPIARATVGRIGQLDGLTVKEVLAATIRAKGTDIGRQEQVGRFECVAKSA